MATRKGLQDAMAPITAWLAPPARKGCNLGDAASHGAPPSSHVRASRIFRSVLRRATVDSPSVSASLTHSYGNGSRYAP